MRHRSLGVVHLLLALAFSTPAASEEGPLRGAVIVVIDTLRADHVGAYGGGVPTPHLDRLAREGVLIEHATTPVPTTAPAVASILTGLYPWRHRILENLGPPIPEDVPTLAELARRGGIRTGAVVASYVVHPDRFSRGFETFEFRPSGTYEWTRRADLLRKVEEGGFWTRGVEITRDATRWLTERAAKPDERFLLFVHYFDPHYPYRPPVEYQVASQEPVDLTGRSVPSEVNGPEELRGLIRGYRGEVRYVDEQVGKLIEWLRLLDLLDRTAVVVTGDHGEGLGEHGLMGHGLNLFDELLHVPLIVRAPGLAAGRRLEGPAQLEDLFPTVLAMLGLAAPERVDGFDLLPWLRGDVPRSPRDAAVGRLKADGHPWPMHFQQTWPTKWIGRLSSEGLVYALDEDPDEVSGTDGVPPPDLLRARVGSPGPDPQVEMTDEETERALRALGYVE